MAVNPTIVTKPIPEKASLPLQRREIIELIGQLVAALEHYAAIDGHSPKSTALAGGQAIWRPISLLANEFGSPPFGFSDCRSGPREGAYLLASEALEVVSQGLGLGGFLPRSQREGIKLLWPTHVAASTIADLRQAADLLALAK